MKCAQKYRCRQDQVSNYEFYLVPELFTVFIMSLWLLFMDSGTTLCKPCCICILSSLLDESSDRRVLPNSLGRLALLHLKKLTGFQLSLLARTPIMADTIVVAGPTHHEEDDLSDDQLQQMLARAAQRRKDGAILKLGDDSASNNKQFTFPKLNTGDIAKPYISTSGDVAHIDSSRLLKEKDRALSNQIRKVEDPVVVKKKTAEVCVHFLPQTLFRL